MPTQTGVFEDIADASSSLGLQLQLNDVEQDLAEARMHRPANTGACSDREEALLLHNDQLVRGLIAINDRQISNKLALAVVQDYNAINAAIAQERQGEADRAFACRLADPRDSSSAQTPRPPASGVAPSPPSTPRGPPHTAPSYPHRAKVRPPPPTFGDSAGPPQSYGKGNPRAQQSAPPAYGLAHPGAQKAPDQPVDQSFTPQTHGSSPEIAQLSRPSDLRSATGPETPSQASGTVNVNEPSSSGQISNHSAPKNGTFANSRPETAVPSFSKPIPFNAWSLTAAKRISSSQPAENPPIQHAESSLSSIPTTQSFKQNAAINLPLPPKPAVSLPSTPRYSEATAPISVNASECSPLQDMTNSPRSTRLPDPVRPSKRPLDDTTTEGQPTAKRVDVGENRDPNIDQVTAGTMRCNLQAECDDALSSRPLKRTIEGAGIGDVPSSKRVDTGQQKGIDLTRKRTRDGADDSDKLSTKRVDTGATKVVTLAAPLSQSFAIQNDVQMGGVSSDITQDRLSNQSEITTSTIPQRSTCVCCGETSQASDVCRGDCNHEYCKDCLQTVVKNAFIDEALFPPRCCKLPFSMDSMRRFLTPELIRQFYELKGEFETANRTYCWNSECSTFLYPDNVLNGEGVCPTCFNVTCTICKGQEHEGDCPKDEGIQQVMNLATKEGWKRCEKCLRVIELQHGCHHITCKCKAEWCYVCGVKWRECECPIWDENHLINRVNRVAAHHPQPANPELWAQAFVAAHNIVVSRHRCTHDSWERVDGKWECEECGDDLPYFIWRCEECEIDACTRCRYNRL